MAYEVSSSDNLATIFNDVFKLAGINSSEVSVQTCDEKEQECLVKIRTPNEAEMKAGSSIKDLMELGDYWMRKYSKKAKRQKGIERLFRPIDRDFFVVDYSRRSGPEGLIYKARGTWFFYRGPLHFKAMDPGIISDVMLHAKKVLRQPDDEYRIGLALRTPKPILNLLKIVEEQYKKDQKDTSTTLNEVLESEGISYFHVDNYDPADGSVTYSSPADIQPDEFSEASSLEDFILVVNQWVQNNPSKVKNRTSFQEPFLKPVFPGWVLVCYEKKPHEILYRTKIGWRKLPSQARLEDLEKEDLASLLISSRVNGKGTESPSYPSLPANSTLLLEFLESVAKRTWGELGLYATATKFDEKMFAFDVKDNSPYPFINPVDRVTLAGNPSVVVPWSDPYLLASWYAYLRENGVENVSSVKGDFAPSRYYFKNLLVMELLQVSSGMQFRIYNPSGIVERVVDVPRPRKPEVVVTLAPDPVKDVTHWVTVYGTAVKVLIFDPSDYPSEKRTEMLKDLGNELQRIPWPLLEPIIKGTNQETPIYFVIGEKDKVRQKGYDIAHNASGQYFGSQNAVWLDPSSIQYATLHEVGGHALDDFSVSDDNEASFSSSPDSNLQRYYSWRLIQVLTAVELVEYNRLVTRLKELQETPSPTEGQKLEVKDLLEKMQPYRKRASKLFVSDYAAEGSSIKRQVFGPKEDFADIMKFFFRGLSNGLELSEWKTWQDEPLMILAGLNYLSHQYHTSQVGSIPSSDFYLKETFREVLKIPLDNLNEDVLAEWKTPTVKDDIYLVPPGVVFATGLGYTTLQNQGAQGDGVLLTTRLGYLHKNLAGGVLIDYEAHDSKSSANIQTNNSLDVGVWLRLQGRPEKNGIFFEPHLGVRDWFNSDDFSLWGGFYTGFGLNGGSVLLGLDVKLNAQNPTLWQSLGIAFSVDLPSLIRSEDK